MTLNYENYYILKIRNQTFKLGYIKVLLNDIYNVSNTLFGVYKSSNA